MSALEPRLFEAPLLRPLDARARSELAAAGKVRTLAPGEIVYRDGDPADAFFVVIEGSVVLEAPEAARAGSRILRRVTQGRSFGEEASDLGARRASRAVADSECRAFELPMASYRRAVARLGQKALLEREERAFRRADLRDRLLAQGLAEDARTLELLLDGGKLVRPAPGRKLFEAGGRASAGFLVLEGMVELLSAGERPRVTAYLAPGDVFAHREAAAAASHPTSAVPLGSTVLLELPPGVLRELAKLDAGWMARADRHGAASEELGAWLERSSRRRTRLALAELPRLAEARSLLAIDLDTCVRCGHCASACASTHAGVSRLSRSGAKVASVLDPAKKLERSLLLPNSCHHCSRPSCLPECPTGAIGRGADGEVFIREELCTGCGACARACPWDNIQMVARPDGKSIATKCDLCSGAETPACVGACPSGALTRGKPELAFSELRRLSGAAAPSVPQPSRKSWGRLAFAACALLLAVHALAWPPAGGKLASGVAAGALVLGLLAHAFGKRRAGKTPVARLLDLHCAFALLAPAAVLAHTGARLGAGAPGALALCFWLATLLGAMTALFYRALPRRLTRLERQVALAERESAERIDLEDRLHRALGASGRTARKVYERLVLPYVRSPLTPLLLLLSGRSLAQEEERLRQRVVGALQGNGRASLEQIDSLLGVAVELAAGPARKVLSSALRGIGVLHLLLAAKLLTLVVVHLIGVLA